MKRLDLLLASAVMLCGPASAMHYDVAVGIRPEAHRLDATVVIRDPASLRFSLYKDFVVRSVIADGKPAAFHIDTSQQASPFTPGAVTVVVEVKDAKVLEVRYGGVMNKAVSGVSMITPGLVELAIPLTWYPCYSMSRDYTFRLTAVLPEGLTVASNGRRLSQSTVGGRTTFVWSSYEPSFDIALVAAPGMHATAAGSPRVEIDYATMPAAFMDAQRDALIKARNRLVAIYGEPHTRMGLQVFFAPRGGYPYSRAPLVLTSEGYAVKDLGNAETEIFRHAAHELAHHWWTIAPALNDEDWTNNCDSWINEGLAEYSAILMVQDVYGEPAARKILEQYRQEAARSRTGDAIAETRQNSPDFFLNRYKKAALMFFAARDRFGGDRVDRMLRSLYARYAGTHLATTGAFLELVKTEMGEEAAAFFREELYRHPEVSTSLPSQQG